MWEKKIEKRYLRSLAVVLLVLSFLLLYLSITIVNQEMKLRDLQQEGDQLQNRVDELNKEVSKMEKKVEESASLEFIEKTAREKLKMVKQNEIIYIIQDEKESD